MRLAELLTKAGLSAEGAGDQAVTGFAIDHRKVAPGTIFGAFEGATVNGEDFIRPAIAAGAIAVVARPEARVEGALGLAMHAATLVDVHGRDVPPQGLGERVARSMDLLGQFACALERGQRRVGLAAIAVQQGQTALDLDDQRMPGIAMRLQVGEGGAIAAHARLRIAQLDVQLGEVAQVFRHAGLVLQRTTGVQRAFEHLSRYLLLARIGTAAAAVESNPVEDFVRAMVELKRTSATCGAA